MLLALPLAATAALCMGGGLLHTRAGLAGARQPLVGAAGALFMPTYVPALTNAAPRPVEGEGTGLGEGTFPCRARRVRMAEGGQSEEILTLSGGRKVLASEIRVAVYGGGSFGTAMACVLGRKGISATLVVRRPEVVEQINTKHINPYYQSDLKLPESVRATTCVLRLLTPTPIRPY